VLQAVEHEIGREEHEQVEVVALAFVASPRDFARKSREARPRHEYLGADWQRRLHRPDQRRVRFGPLARALGRPIAAQGVQRAGKFVRMMARHPPAPERKGRRGHGFGVKLRRERARRLAHVQKHPVEEQLVGAQALIVGG
jgi:hypothetical protein